VGIHRAAVGRQETQVDEMEMGLDGLNHQSKMNINLISIQFYLYKFKVH
jgi:hypothetical protein